MWNNTPTTTKKLLEHIFVYLILTNKKNHENHYSNFRSVYLQHTYTHTHTLTAHNYPIASGFYERQIKKMSFYQCIYLKWSVISEITMHVWSFLLFSPTILYLLLVWKIKISTNCWSILSDGFYVNWFCLQNFWNMLLFAVTFNRIFFVYFFSSIVN